MQLLATTYHSIWPFLDRTITVAFRKGKYLIKAPIGSGKSFLFFDGPVFGLYKYGGRTMLSMKAKEGSIAALFEAGDNYFLVIRGLTRTKSGGDSVKSKLYQIESTGEEIRKAVDSLSDVVNEETDIENILRHHQIKLEEVVFKNETDLQQNLTDFLPPREVYTTTTFLMQDSENMFEMTPSDRINVFKNIFWLLDIDEAKELISDAKKETTALLKSRRNTDDVNTKLHRLVHEYIETVSMNNEWLTDEIISHTSDWQLVKEKLSIENFDIASLPLASRQWLAVSYDKKRSDYQWLLGKLQAIERQYKEALTERENIARQKVETEKTITQLQQKLALNNTELINKLQDERQQQRTQQQTLLNKLPLSELWVESLSELILAIGEILQKGKNLTEKKELYEQKIQIKDKQIIESDERKKSLEEQLTVVAESRKKHEFICDLIGDKPCPYVDLINQSNTKNTDKQEELLQKQLWQLDKATLEKEREELVREMEKVEKELVEARENYKKYSSPEIKETIEQYKIGEKKLREIEEQLTKHEQERKQQEDYQKELTQQQVKLEQYGVTDKNLQEQVEKLQWEISTLRSETNTSELDKVEFILTTIAKAMKMLEAISELVSTHKNNLLMIKQLEEKETMLGQLFNIFSKEIMIYVLQQTLPLFSDVLNNLLAKVVDYTVSFETKNVSEKVELEIKIHDSKWERLVKSLSGGQKTVLRLTWTLAICIFTRSNALFLDETVNNIDRDTIGKVADLIEDFTKTHDITFYIITHSEAIQDMEIWDKVISL